MKTKRVNRYYCDFCGKGGCSAGHMRRHEERCTLNLQRECGVCKMIEASPKPLEELIAALPRPMSHASMSFDHAFGTHYDPRPMCDAIEKTLPKLRELADGCPACMLAALRQRGLLEWCGQDVFSYKVEMDSVFGDLREAEHRADLMACQHG